jgi:hypothetical protein
MGLRPSRRSNFTTNRSILRNSLVCAERERICLANTLNGEFEPYVDHLDQFCYTGPKAQPTRPGGVFRVGHAGLVTV